MQKHLNFPTPNLNYFKLNFLQNLLEEVEEILLGGWNCLLMGKYTDISVESEIRKLVDQFLKEK